MSSAPYRGVMSMVGTGYQLTPLASGISHFVASGPEQFLAMLTLLPQPARQCFGAPMVDESALRGVEFFRTQIPTLIGPQLDSLRTGDAPSKCIVLKLADGRVVFGGIVG